VVLVAVGVGAIVERSVAVFNVVKLLGAGYLVWLGIQAIRTRAGVGDALEVSAQTRRTRSVFVDGLVVGVANPKAIVFFAAILPQFVEPAGAPAGIQMLFLGLVFVALAVVSDGLWGLAAGTARNWIAGSPHRLERLTALGGAVMIGLGVQLALTGRKD
ncbi:MAG: LysE family translocator, partial [Actinomycetota bacterium]